MNIAIFANGKAAIPSIKFLLQNKETILIVVDPQDTGENTWQPSLKAFCTSNLIPFLAPASFNDLEFLQELSAFNPDIIFSIQCRRIIKKKIIDIVKGEIFNFHFADLPRNRGCFPGVWHLLNDDYIGVTLHKLTEGIDDGPVIDKIRKRIVISDTGRSVYEWCCEQVLPLLKRNFKKISQRSYKETKQDEKLSNYYSRFSLSFSNLYVDWNQDGRKVARFIQAFIFPPYQFPKTRYEKDEISIIAVSKIEKRKRNTFPGKIIKQNNENVEVEVKDGSITIQVANKENLNTGTFFYL